MSQFQGWAVVARSLQALAEVKRHEPRGPATRDWTLDEGQCRSLDAIAKRIKHHGVLLADEVGMGKTRIAVALAKSVVESGGRVAVLVPPGLGFQWQDELQHGGLPCKPVLRSLRQYLSAWEQIGPDSDPWFSQSVVLVSHAFTNWRLSASAATWRWALLPELYAHWRRYRNGRFPNNYHQDERLIGPHQQRDQRLSRAASDIVALATDGAHQDMAAGLDELIEKTPWMESLDAQAYANHAELRPRLEQAVGLGLGYFDLVIIDEAHKSRGANAGLTRLLEKVIRQHDTMNRDGGRRLGMTATPVELDTLQWCQALKRVVPDIYADPVLPAIEAYAKAVRDVREQPTQAQVREAVQGAARGFQDALSPYLLRRDKRESNWVRRFHEGTGLPFHAYRQESQISIETASLPGHWRQAICAAEALSQLARYQGDGQSQRLRLTIGNGHGINSVLDAWTHDEAADARQLQHEAAAGEQPAAPHAVAPTGQDTQRARWWMDVLATAFATDGASLHEHPGILAAVQAIEEADAQGEKVLVFGRFTRPMRALVGLLNARAMLRCLDEGRPWPQASVHEDEWAAVQAAHRHLGRPGPVERMVLDGQLHQQYALLENVRERIRDQLLKHLDIGLPVMPPTSLARRLFVALSESRQGLAPLTKALAEMLGENAERESSAAWAEAFVELVEASSDRDEGDDDSDGKLDADEARALWATLAQRLHDEYDRPQGGFARLMYGETAPPTRRLLQMAFNRTRSFPRVLVAQSLVGREGLNLHRACRTVVLLHPEWNPGVVEQQIGRVDRVGSRWEQLLAQAIDGGVDPVHWPRIRILPVVFKGTYDEMNWRVLRQRWDELRAQLHGVVIPESARCGDAVMDGWIDEINATAPTFSPP